MRPFARWSIWIGSVLSGATGLAYWWMLHMMEPVSEWAVINHPLQPWVLKAHIVTSPLLVFAIGLIAMDHVWKQFRLGIRAGRRSGVTAMWVFAPMVVSGYLIQAVTPPGWLRVVIWVHVVTGLVFLMGLGAHQAVVPRRTRTRRRVVDLDVVRAPEPTGRDASPKSRSPVRPERQQSGTSP